MLPDNCVSRATTKGPLSNNLFFSFCQKQFNSASPQFDTWSISPLRWLKGRGADLLKNQSASFSFCMFLFWRETLMSLEFNIRVVFCVYCCFTGLLFGILDTLRNKNVLYDNTALGLPMMHGIYKLSFVSHGWLPVPESGSTEGFFLPNAAHTESSDSWGSIKHLQSKDDCDSELSHSSLSQIKVCYVNKTEGRLNVHITRFKSSTRTSNPVHKALNSNNATSGASSWGVSGRFYREEVLGQTQDSLERLYFSGTTGGQVAGTGGRGEGGLRLLLDGWTDGCAYIIIEDSVGRLVLETVPDPILGVPHIKTLQKLFCKTLNYSCSSPRDLYSLNLWWDEDERLKRQCS